MKKRRKGEIFSQHLSKSSRFKQFCNCFLVFKNIETINNIDGFFIDFLKQSDQNLSKSYEKCERNKGSYCTTFAKFETSVTPRVKGNFKLRIFRLKFYA